MTLPYERTRAVISAVDFLTRLISPYGKNGIKKIPKAVRQEALRILRHFPRPYDLYAAAECAPDVFDAQTLLRYDEEREKAGGLFSDYCLPDNYLEMLYPPETQSHDHDSAR